MFDVHVTVLTPFPGTPLYDRLLPEGRTLEPGRWDKGTLVDVNVFGHVIGRIGEPVPSQGRPETARGQVVVDSKLGYGVGDRIVIGRWPLCRFPLATAVVSPAPTSAAARPTTSHRPYRFRVLIIRSPFQSWTSR